MKIALCISGETREYNKYHGPDTLITLLLDLGHTVDIFAHTWEHCERPVKLLYPIKKLINFHFDKIKQNEKRQTSLS